MKTRRSRQSNKDIVAQALISTSVCAFLLMAVEVSENMAVALDAVISVSHHRRDGSIKNDKKG